MLWTETGYVFFFLFPLPQTGVITIKCVELSFPFSIRSLQFIIHGFSLQCECTSMCSAVVTQHVVQCWVVRNYTIVANLGVQSLSGNI